MRCLRAYDGRTGTHAHSLDLTADDVLRIRSGERVSRHASDGFDDKHDHLLTFN